MEQSGFVVAIDLGTSKIVGLMGRKNEQGVISILASESIPSENCVKYGVVYNIDEAAGKVKRIINLLENKSGRKIAKAYVSVAGKSLRAIEHAITKDLGGETEVTFSMVDQMEQQARLIHPDFLINYSVVSPEIFLDGTPQEDYIGKRASLIEGRYRLIVGRSNIKNNLSKCIVDKNQLGIAGYVVGPVAAGAIVLDEADKQAGCALVDFGAGTTTLSIYKNGTLKYMVVIPFGGRTITKDIKELGFIDETAETYKIKYGKIGKDKNKAQPSGASDVDLKELNKVIQLRAEEIILNIIHQIRESGYENQLEAGIIMIGGASQLSGLQAFLEEKAQMPVRKGAARRLYINNVTDLLQDPAYMQALGLLLFASENCEKQEPVHTTAHFDDHRPQSHPISAEKPDTPVEKEPEPVKEKPHRQEKTKKSHGILDLFGKIQNLGGTMFKDED